MAGIGLVLSVSAVAFFDGGFLSTDIEKSGKSDIQEAIKNTDPPLTETTAIEETDTGAIIPVLTDIESGATTPTTETETISGATDTGTIVTGVDTTLVVTPVKVPNYEIGKDYSVTKNTKKNIRTKTASGTLSGTGTITPEKDLIK